MVTSDLSRIEKKILLRAPRSRVWRAITSPNEFSKWFGVEFSGQFASGADLRMTSTAAGYAGVEFTVHVEQVAPEHTFSWRWHPGMVDPNIDYSKEPSTLVVFRLEDAPGGTMVTVIETGFDEISLTRRAAVYKDNEGGWEYQLKSLERYVGAEA